MKMLHMMKELAYEQPPLSAAYTTIQCTIKLTGGKKMQMEVI
jgi:hypothetical protein